MLDSTLIFRVADSTKSDLESIAQQTGLRASDLARIAHIEGIRVVEEVRALKRPELSLNDALVLRANGAEWQ